MGRIGIIKHENYDPVKVEQICRIIEVGSQTGQSRDYEMLLDGLKIVPRTADPETFASFQQFVKHDSECLTIFLYYGLSNHYDSYYFYFKGIPPGKDKSQALSGVNIADLEKQQKEKILKEMHYESLVKENEDLKSQLEELEEKFVAQQEDIEKAKSSKIDSYSDVGIVILMKLMAIPAIQKKFPGLQGIVGELNGTPSSDQKKEDEPVATFRRKGEARDQGDSNGKHETQESTPTGLTEAQVAFLQMYDALLESLNEEQFKSLIEILITLGSDPVAIRPTKKYIENFLKNKPQEGKKAA